MINIDQQRCLEDRLANRSSPLVVKIVIAIFDIDYRPFIDGITLRNGDLQAQVTNQLLATVVESR